jgi:hypothetical protein
MISCNSFHELGTSRLCLNAALKTCASLAKLQIYNYAGILVAEQKVNNQSKVIVSVKEYPVGLYLYKLVDGVNTISKGKFNVIK